MPCDLQRCYVVLVLEVKRKRGDERFVEISV